ncbi:patatin-like protein 1 [Gastrolobium bilobum]|uniref:patatin-like protein 1 n=1 Tax=Gastrolobium bilobum TaxID=150636 RepID=UPI002AAFC80F|nr:patatin-like protein 1 [Gastrolobium bilobum]
MAPFLLFLFVFATQVIAGFNTKLPPLSYGNQVTILSIDGGGIRGIVPAVVLDHLEKALQKKDEKATLANYFDVIAGTSTGGLMAAMLSTPHPNHPYRPLFTPAEIVDFYKKYGPHIFNETSGWNSTYPGPKYDGKFLHGIIRKVLKNSRLGETLTNVVIPTFDLKKLHPVIFSNYKIMTRPSLDAKMSDICIGTSAAPTYLPPYYFKNNDTEFNLVDGGVAATNPAMIAVSEVTQQEKIPYIFPWWKESTKIVLVSVGCGTSNVTGYDVKTAANWSEAFWAASGIATGGYDYAAKDMTEYYLATMFSSPRFAHNYYLRIQEYNLDPSMNNLDNATEENLENLVNVGNNLLKQPVLSMNVDTFVPEKKPLEGTNAEALERLAERLYNEKQVRLRKKAMEKSGRPLTETSAFSFGRTKTS